ncbi:hypothetical protein B0H13DRAFT_1873045 [Mycena leptocephala]|nr:hypothetical protein B0H13DRAFT_1873045 [Mycena leptocephala]
MKGMSVPAQSTAHNKCTHLRSIPAPALPPCSRRRACDHIRGDLFAGNDSAERRLLPAQRATKALHNGGMRAGRPIVCLAYAAIRKPTPTTRYRNGHSKRDRRVITLDTYLVLGYWGSLQSLQRSYAGVSRKRESVAPVLSKLRAQWRRFQGQGQDMICSVFPRDKGVHAAELEL